MHDQVGTAQAPAPTGLVHKPPEIFAPPPGQLAAHGVKVSVDGLQDPDLGADNPVPHISIYCGFDPGSGSKLHTQVLDDGPTAPPQLPVDESIQRKTVQRRFDGGPQQLPNSASSPRVEHVYGGLGSGEPLKLGG